MTVAPETERRPRPLRPKDAATLVVVDDSAPEPRLLMGRRCADLAFMPNKYVFPGGRVDRCDRVQPAADELGSFDLDMLQLRVQGRASAARARGLALAAVREAFEETGIVIGQAVAQSAPAASAAGYVAGKPPPEALHDKRQGKQHRVEAAEVWQAFLATGHVPALAPLSLLARAITPPGRVRRYDTRFFLVSARAIALQTPHRDEELSHIDWFTLDEIRALDLPGITRAIVEDLGERLAAGWSGIPSAEPPPDGGEGTSRIPFYYYLGGSFRRELLARDGSRSPSQVWRR